MYLSNIPLGLQDARSEQRTGGAGKRLVRSVGSTRRFPATGPVQQLRILKSERYMQQVGFSLIEALLSLMIFSMFLLGMWQLVHNSFIHIAKVLKVEQMQHELVQAGEQQLAYPKSDLDNESTLWSHGFKAYLHENYVELFLCDQQQKNFCASLAIQNLQLDFR